MTKTTQRQLQKEQTRTRILEIAREQYALNGIMATRTVDIAKAAGVSHGTIFSHYATQEDLLNTVIEEFGMTVSKRLHELVSAKMNLKQVLESHLAGLMEFEDFYTRLVIEGRLLPQSARNTMAIIQSSISFHMSQAAELAMNKGIIEQYPIHMLFNTWIGLIHYYLSNSDLFAPGESVLRRYGQEILEHYMKLISRR